MINRNEMIIWVNRRYYCQLDLIPVKNEQDVYVNSCTLVDSEEKKPIETIAFRADILLPVLKNKDMDCFKVIGEQIRHMALRNNVVPARAADMPKGARQTGKLEVKDRLKEQDDKK